MKTSRYPELAQQRKTRSHWGFEGIRTTTLRFVLAISIALAFLTSNTAMVFAGTARAVAEEPETAAITVPVEEVSLIELLRNVKSFIQNYHTKEVTEQELYQGAIKGMLDIINDPYSGYLAQEEFDGLSSSLEGEFSGVGITIELIDGNITVVSTFKNSPAENAGMQPGDIITGVGRHDLRGKTHTDAANLLRGPQDTEVTVEIRRPSTGETLNLTMVRAIIKPPTIDLKDLGDGIYYIEISQFTTATGREFPVIIGHLKSRDLKGLVLDLRNNPGGLLWDAIDVAEKLVPKGPVVELRRKQLKEVVETEEDTVPVPTVVLVNKGTASAAEILAGAIRDRGVGILVGEPTFGKACVQTITPLGHGMGGIRLTIADYYTPSGQSISGTGLSPDVPVEREPVILPQKISYKRPLRKGLVGLDVLSLQESLNFLGYDAGKPDGIFGPKTQAAASAFFKDRGLAFSGFVTEEEVDRLYLATLEHLKTIPDPVFDKGVGVLKARLETGSW